MKYTTKIIRDKLQIEGYQLLTEYKKALSPIQVKCPKGHIYETKWNNFQQGSRCPICYEKKSGRKHNFSYNDVIEQIENEGYQVLQCDYKNRYSKIQVKCPKGHIYETKWNNWKSGTRCPECAGNMRIPFKDVKDLFENEGYEVLTKEEDYKGIWTTKIEYICDNGHEGNMLGSNFRKGHRCKYCMRIPFETIIETFENEGYEVLTKEEEFVSTVKTKIKYRCKKNHIHSMEWNNFKQGRRCPECAGLITYYEDVKNYIANEGYILLSTEYINKKEKLNVMCDKGHEYKVTWANFREGRRCPICNGFSTKRLTYEYVKEQIESVEGYKLLSTKYKNNSTEIRIQCDKGHIYDGKYAYFKRGSRCPICNNLSKSSKGETEVFEYVKSIIDDEVIENDRTQLINPLTGCNLEFDIWIPSLNKAIEYNGVYWHNNEYQQYKDNIKEEQCKEKGIDLLVIEDTEWLNNKDRCKKEIKKHVDKIYK